MAPDEMPEDYRALLAGTGPGTLAGVLRLLAPGGPDGFDMQTEQQRHASPHPDAQLWGVFDSGETCWWLPIRDNPRRWLLVVVGAGQQQLNITTTDFLRRWVAGHLDLPVLSLPPAVRTWAVTPSGGSVVIANVPTLSRDPLAQLRTIIGPGSPQILDWPMIERDVGCRLPPDYKRLYAAYRAPVAVNGIFVSAPDELLSTQGMLGELLQMFATGAGYRVYPEPGGLLVCVHTEGRDVLCWDTRHPDPSTWPLVDTSSGAVSAGTVTQLLIAELIGTGPGLSRFELGDPAKWAWPIWGPDEPW